jgi:hypothetical protein
MVTKGRQIRPGSADFWNYVPDPGRTVFYLLVGVIAVAAAEWVPELAAQMEQTRIQERIQETRNRQLAEYAIWRRQYPDYDRLVDEIAAQEIAQAELESISDYPLAQPGAPMSPMNSESTTPPTWN